MKKNKLSLIVTVLNEEKHIGKLIDSIAIQSIIPNEIIIADGGSTDNTLKKIREKRFFYKNRLNIKLIEKKGNRSVGRNEAIKISTGNIILSTDSGCFLDRNWIKNIVSSFSDSNTKVVAGYYKGNYENIFQKSLIPYVLVMEDKIKDEFLPATRSMAFRKEIWKKIEEFDENLSHNEDYAFANKIKKFGFKIKFVQNAVVNWIPRKNIKQAFVMFFRFALGDIQANILRPKVFFIFLRYIFAIYLIILNPIMKSYPLVVFTILLFLSYILWSIYKNYKYVNSYKAFFYLPLLQFTSDFSVMFGTVLGLLQKIKLKSIYKILNNNKFFLLIVGMYILIELLLLPIGIPNQNHPFTYFMDEWHFSQTLRAFVTHGTGLVSGSANIPFYHIVSSLIFLVPFYLFRIVDPLAIKSSIDNLPMQQVLFDILRLHTLLYGALSVWVIYDLLKKYIKKFSIIFTAIFTFTPIWLLLTNYYKYDITLVFWIITTIYLILKYYKSQNINHFIFAGIACGLALSTKFTAAPLFLSYVLSYFIFTTNKNYKYFSVAIFVSIIVFVLVGIPDIVFGKGNYNELISSTMVQGPKASESFNLGYPAWLYLIFKQFPSIFGYFITVFYYLSLFFYTIYLFIKFIKNRIGEYKIELFLYLSSILFLLSTVSFNLDGGGNRALVLLLFMVLLSGLLVKRFSNTFIYAKYKKAVHLILIAGIILQIFQSYAWVSVKIYSDPRSFSSKWILENIPKGSEIGIENIPIYQMLPDFALKEYYFKKYNNNFKTFYKYKVISSEDKLPKYVIVTNDFDNLNYINKSPKKDLVRKLNKEGYKKIRVFSPELKYYNLFADKMYFIIANIIQTPVSISIYEE